MVVFINTITAQRLKWSSVTVIAFVVVLCTQHSRKTVSDAYCWFIGEFVFVHLLIKKVFNYSKSCSRVIQDGPGQVD